MDMNGYSKFNTEYRTHTDQTLSECRRNLLNEQRNHIDNLLLNVAHVENNGELPPIIRRRAFSEPVQFLQETGSINDVHGDSGILLNEQSNHIDNLFHNVAHVDNNGELSPITRRRAFSEPVQFLQETGSINGVHGDSGIHRLTKIQSEFIHNPHKRELALSLFNEIALNNLPDNVKNFHCNTEGENLKTFLGIIASQKDKFTDQEKKEFDEICHDFKQAGSDRLKQERVYGLIKNLLARHGESALNCHYSYFIGFCICAWQQYHGYNAQNYSGDDIFNKSLHACKENIDRYIKKLVNAKDLEDVAICKAVEEFKNNTIAIPLTLRFKTINSFNKNDTLTQDRPSLVEFGERPEINFSKKPVATFSRERKENGDVHIHLSIENIGNNNGSRIENIGNNNGSRIENFGNDKDKNIEELLSSSVTTIAEQVYDRLIHDFSGTSKGTDKRIKMIKEFLSHYHGSEDTT
ncbi:hypothetical protein OQB17_004443, partial [Salmonella enterica]|nr:hypothetical protein [Salmonella enterica]